MDITIVHTQGTVQGLVVALAMEVPAARAASYCQGCVEGWVGALAMEVPTATAAFGA